MEFQPLKFQTRGVKDIFKNKKLVVVSAAPLIRKSDGYAAYSPYAKEMELWAKHCDEIYFCCPIWDEDRNLLHSDINFKIAKVYQVKEFSKGLGSAFSSFRSVVQNFFIIFRALKAADHIHLRCPGNIGLLGCIVQIFFPSTQKSAKYAGNWDSKSEQPLSYKLQKWILSNSFLTRNIQVLVYGEWPNQTKNIKAFFTASYFETDKIEILDKSLDSVIKFLYVGTLSAGKRPLYTIKLVHQLLKEGVNASLTVYGEGPQREIIEKYIRDNSLEKYIILFGNKEENIVRAAYQESHFIVLASKSEGWPKVIAEAMFWKCFPVATNVSCISNMIGGDSRGVILNMDLLEDAQTILKIINSPKEFLQKSQNAMEWSRSFTLDLFEKEIEQILSK